MTTLVKAFNKLQNALISIGVDKEKADEVAETFTDMIENRLATKDDLKVIEAKLKYLQWLMGAVGVSVLLNIVLSLI